MPSVELAIDGMVFAEKCASLGQALCDLHRDGAHCDVILTCGGERFPAHRVVLAATSCVWRERLQSVQDCEVPITEVSESAAVRLMISFAYDADSLGTAYDPGSPEVNRDVLILARCFEIAQLSELAMHWLAKDVTTANVVDRLRACREFKLESLHARIIEELIGNRSVLTEVACSSQIARYPEIMQAILQQAAANASLEARVGHQHPASAVDKSGELDEKPIDPVSEDSVASVTEEQPPVDDPTEVSTERAAEAIVESDPVPVVKRRRSSGKHSEDRAAAEKPAEIAAEDAAVAITEGAPKKRLKKSAGK